LVTWLVLLNLELIYEKSFYQSELFFKSIAILAKSKLDLK